MANLANFMRHHHECYRSNAYGHQPWRGIYLPDRSNENAIRKCLAAGFNVFRIRVPMPHQLGQLPSQTHELMSLCATEGVQVVLDLSSWTQPDQCTVKPLTQESIIQSFSALIPSFAAYFEHISGLVLPVMVSSPLKFAASLVTALRDGGLKAESCA